MAKTNWTNEDTVLPQDLNDIGQEINDLKQNSTRIVLSMSEPDNPTTQTWWYQDMGDSPDFEGNGGLIIGNASLQPDEKVWFEKV
ncbi:MAG TPA: hypothetical protein VKZ95_04535 [Sphingobacteriaceae bacterium]|nr:hypothetical protein [Sphingobacteriaceae bacterium]